MKLSRFQKQVLCFIEREYPIPFDSSAKNQIIALGERPLATRDSIKKQFPKNAEQEIDEAIKTLIAFQHVAKVYLRGIGEFKEFQVAPGEILRTPTAGPKGSGIDGYQITAIGKETVAKLPVNAVAKALPSFISGFLKDHSKVIVLGLGTLGTMATGVLVRIGCQVSQPAAPKVAVDKPIEKTQAETKPVTPKAKSSDMPKAEIAPQATK